MSDLLFAVPWYLPTLLGVVGIALLVSGNRRGAGPMRNGGAAILLVAVAWALLSYFVDTDKEKVEKGTRAMVQDVVDGHWDAFKGELIPSASFTVQSGAPLSNSADDITQMAQSGAESVRLKGATVRNLEVEQTGPLINARFDVLSQQDMVPLQRSSWVFEWEQTSAGWKCRTIRMMSLEGLQSDDLTRVLPKGKR